MGVSAIDKIILVYTALLGLERRWAGAKRHPLFAPGHFAIYPGVFVGGPRSGLVPFFIADAARIEYVVVYHPDDDPDSVRAEIAGCVADVALQDAGRHQPPEITWNHHWPVSKLPVEHPIVAAATRAHQAATGAAPSSTALPPSTTPRS